MRTIAALTALLRTITALAALLVCAGAWTQDAEEPAEAVKVLGFTLDVPVPPGALPESAEPVLWTDDGTYTVYAAIHPWCESLFAIADRAHGVFYVECGDGRSVLWERRLRMRHGGPVAYDVVEGSLLSIYLPDKFAFIGHKDDSVYWLSRHGPLFDCEQRDDFLDCPREEEESWNGSLSSRTDAEKIRSSMGTALSKADSIRGMAADQTVARQSEGEDF